MPEVLQRRFVEPQQQLSEKLLISREKYGEYTSLSGKNNLDTQQISHLRNKDRDVWGSEAFNLNFDTKPTRDELRADLVSYLGEYRLQVQKYDYTLVFGRDKDRRGPITIRDEGRGEPVQHKTKRVLEERRIKWQPTHREEAEDVGLGFLNDQLRSAQTGDTVVWASPPGPKEQGYGDYGFVYMGKVTKFNNGEARLAMTAIRVEKPREDQEDKKKNNQDALWVKRFHNVITKLTNKDLPHRTAEDFISTPLVIRKAIPDKQVDNVLNQEFSFEPNAQEKETFKEIIKKMSPLIEESIEVILDGSNKDKVKALHSLENYALKLKKEYQAEQGENVVYKKQDQEQRTLRDIMDDYGYEPPAAGGSCGSTGSSNGLISAQGGATISFALGGGEGGRTLDCKSCPLCGARDIKATISGGRITCPSCNGSAEYNC